MSVGQKMTETGPLVRRMLEGVNLELWGPFIDDVRLGMSLEAIENLGDTDRIAPPAGLVFEALRYGGPDDVAAVVLGQDPYPGQGEACGLCFSVGGGLPVPDSLRRVFGCLERAGLRPAAGTRPESGDLRPWAAQGVLLLNTALTTRVGHSHTHAKVWAPFVCEFIRRLCDWAERAAKRVPFLLWGGDARGYAPLIRRFGLATLEWTHPSPLADNRLPEQARFRMCPHFEEVNALLVAQNRRRVVWDNLAPVVAFTDGSCPLNGKSGARAACAAVLTGGQFGGTVLRAEVSPSEYALVDPSEPERGVAPTGTPATPSNNRAEMLGLIYAFLGLIRGRAVGPVEIVTDSEICQMTLLEWYPTRRAKGTERQLKNFDLVAAAAALLEVLRRQAASVELTHVRSHRAAPPASAPVRERLLHRGNALADEHAAAPLRASSPAYTLEVIGGPPALASFATPRV